VTLADIKKDKTYKVVSIEDSKYKVQILEFGLFKDQIVKLVYKAPFSGPIAILTGDFSSHPIAITKKEAELIILEEITTI